MPEDQKPQPPEMLIESDGTVKVGFERSPLFRTVYAENVFGGVSPRRMLRMSFLNESAPLPSTVDYHVGDRNGGKVAIGKEKSRVVSEVTFVRTIEVEVVMSLENARNFHNWLTAKIKDLESAHSKK